MKNFLLAFLSVAILCGIQSCNSSKNLGKSNAMANETLHQFKWYLAELNGKAYTFMGMNNENSWIQFSNDGSAKVSGSTGCNRIMGGVEMDGANHLKFSALATTKMACQGNSEPELMSALSKVNNYAIADTQLLLKQDTTIIARLNGVSAETDQLSGSWELNYISGTRIAFAGLYPDKKPVISFNFAEKAIMGNTSCNGFSSQYSMNGHAIKFADGLKTMIFCEGGGEEAFLNMLKKVNRYSVSENTLNLLIDDVAVMRFGKK